jgi:TolB-like protein
VALLIAVFILAIMLGNFRQNPDPTPPPDTQQTVAVLPFTTMEPDSRDSYLAHGMLIELLTRLGTIDGLNVLGYISSALVTKDGLDYQEAGKRLGATVLILGSLRRVDKRLLVYVEVVESVSGQQLWSRRFDLQDSDIFVLEAEIANQVAQALGRVYNHPGASYKSKPSISLLEAYDSRHRFRPALLQCTHFEPAREWGPEAEPGTAQQM